MGLMDDLKKLADAGVELLSDEETPDERRAYVASDDKRIRLEFTCLCGFSHSYNLLSQSPSEVTQLISEHFDACQKAQAAARFHR